MTLIKIAMIIGKMFYKHFIDKGNFKFLGTKKISS